MSSQDSHTLPLPPYIRFPGNNSLKMSFYETNISSSFAHRTLIRCLMLHSTILSMLSDLHNILTYQPGSFSPFIMMLYALYPSISHPEILSNGPWPAESYNVTRSIRYPTILRELYESLWPHDSAQPTSRFQCASRSILVTLSPAFEVTFRHFAPHNDGLSQITFDVRLLYILATLITPASFSDETFRPVSAATSIDFVNIVEKITSFSMNNSNLIRRSFFPISSYNPSLSFDIAYGTSIHYGLQSTFYRMITSLLNTASDSIIPNHTGITLYNSFPFTCLPLCSHAYSPQTEEGSRVYVANFILEIDVSYFRSVPSQKTDTYPASDTSSDPLLTKIDSLSTELVDKILFNIFASSYRSKCDLASDTIMAADFPEPHRLYSLIRPPRPPRNIPTSQGYDFGHSLRLQFPVTFILYIKGLHQQATISERLISDPSQFNPSILSTDFHISESHLAPFALPLVQKNKSCLLTSEFPQQWPSLLRSLDETHEVEQHWCRHPAPPPLRR